MPADIQRRARVRLQRVVAAAAVADLRVPPSHRLEALRGDRKGQYSIRINDQWRVCFVWTDQGAMEIEVTDYH
ncbi:MAG: type II toxin-antitoxin system RelE/ParE family toxin [bacterium]|nr:type II toxin-antitoxin system RelE/ParE family toxin [bacterium]